MAGLIKRGKKYYLVYFEGQNERRVSLRTDSYQIAREKKRQFESKMLAGHSDCLPTKTQLAQILDRYIDYIAAKKTPKSVQTDVYYLRGMFGPIGYHHGQVHLAGLIETLIMRLMVIFGDDHEQRLKYTDPTAAVLADGG